MAEQDLPRKAPAIWSGFRRRLFHLLFLIRRPMTFGVRGLVLNRETNSVFLVKHTYVPGFQLPGGGVETGETALEALERELREEGNIRLIARPELKSVHFNRHASKRDHVLLYLITGFSLEGAKRADREIAEAGFFPISDLPADTTLGTRRRIAEILDGEDASPYW
ncbi:NUDIX domain-containing protein [Mesorhizobium sp. Z1-4]|uniref:NUDIX domain-containing protein n=1 Tax=Mesorhizobium sp. Z1-4 TaxID=2448478 RepID=UPI000FD7C69F|nr:NUDIX domain-containing protein [Mesorhizobium sp. Z1-4]